MFAKIMSYVGIFLLAITFIYAIAKFPETIAQKPKATDSPRVSAEEAVEEAVRAYVFNREQLTHTPAPTNTPHRSFGGGGIVAQKEHYEYNNYTKAIEDLCRLYEEDYQRDAKLLLEDAEHGIPYEEFDYDLAKSVLEYVENEYQGDMQKFIEENSRTDYECLHEYSYSEYGKTFSDEDENADLDEPVDEFGEEQEEDDDQYDLRY